MKYIAIGNEKLHYIQAGAGPKLLLAFHGYGNDAELFRDFMPHLHNQFTVLSFDLPHHGKSTWTKDTPLTKKDLVRLVEDIKKLYHVDKVSLLGYSMGGRVSLTITQLAPESVDRVVVIASDGLRVDYFYYFLTRTLIGRTIFRTQLNKPKRFFGVIEWMKRRKLLDAHKYKFVMNYMKPHDSRKFLMQVWPGMSDIMTNPTRLKNIIRRHRIPVAIFMGAYDRVMPPALAEKFMQGLDTVQLHVLEKGHRVFDSGNAHEIAKSLL